MASDDGLGLDDDEHVAPAGPAAAQGCPDEAITSVEGGSWSFAFQDGDLLPQGQDLEDSVDAVAEEDPDHG